MFNTLFGLTIESLANLTIEYSLSPYSSFDDTIKELQSTINELSIKIKNLITENEELRENYWRLNQSIKKAYKISLFCINSLPFHQNFS